MNAKSQRRRDAKEEVGTTNLTNNTNVEEGQETKAGKEEGWDSRRLGWNLALPM